MSDLFDFLDSIGCNSRTMKGIDYNTIKLNDDIRKRWGKLSSLDYLEDELKDKCILSLERFGVYMVNIYKKHTNRYRTKDEENYWLNLAIPSIIDVIKETGIILKPEIVSNTLYLFSQTFNDKSIVEAKKEFLGEIFFDNYMTTLVSRSVIGEMVSLGEYKLTKKRKEKEEG